MDNILVALQASGLSPSHNGALTAAAAAGDLPTLQALVRHGCRANCKVLAQAAAAGRRDICEWLIHQGCADASHAETAAAAGGHVALLDWLLQLPGPHQQYVLKEQLLEGTAFGCDVPTLMRIHEEAFIGTGTNLAVGDGYKRYLASAICSPTRDGLAKVDWLLSFGVRRQNNKPTILPDLYPDSFHLPTVPRCGSWSRSTVEPSELLRRAMFLMQERGLELHEDAVLLAAAQGNTEAAHQLLGAQQGNVLGARQGGDESTRARCSSTGSACCGRLQRRRQRGATWRFCSYCGGKACALCRRGKRNAWARECTTREQRRRAWMQL